MRPSKKTIVFQNINLAYSGQQYELWFLKILSYYTL